MKRATYLSIVFLIVTGLLLPDAFAQSMDAFKGLKGTIRISGGTAHIPVMKEAAKRIMQTYPDIQISVAGGGSGVGIKQVGEGLVDIGNSGRKPSEKEIADYGLKLFKWAVDGVGVVVNPGNRVKSLTGQQLIDVYSGKINNWKLLGGADKPITVYTRDEASGTRKVFWSKALKKGAITKSANFVVSNGAMKSSVANDPYGIGYISVGYIDNSVSPVALDGIVPDLENVKAGKYTVARGLYSNTRGNPEGLTRVFIDYLYSSEGQSIISSKGFIPVK